MKESAQVVLFTDFEVPECQRRLSGAIDELHRTPLGYKGRKELLGKITGNSFSLRLRRDANNLLSPTFYGRMYPQDGRTRIDGYFERPSWKARSVDLKSMTVFTVVLALLFFACLADALRGTVTSGSLLVLIVFPIFMAYLTRDLRRAIYGTKAEILEFLQNTLLAQIEPRPQALDPTRQRT